MIRGKMTFKGWAFAFLCFYACCYPICAQLLLNQESEGVGSSGLQALQGGTLIALLYFWKLPSSIRVINLWLVGVLYFTVISVYMALFYAFDEKKVELTFAFRFISWFIFAFALEQRRFSPEQIKTMVGCFSTGVAIQCLLAIVYYVFDIGGDSIYSDLHASVGSTHVSGKTIVSFVGIEIFLAFYWFIKKRRNRFWFLCLIILGILVVLFSYNRAGQLSLLVAALWVLIYLARKNQFKILLAIGAAVTVIAFFLASVYGNAFLKRWEQLRTDEGSGRVEMAKAAWGNLIDPKSPESLLIGRGYHKTKNLMFNVFGIRIGTHSDLLDFVTAYGLVGLIFYILFVLRFFSYSGRIVDKPLERLCCRASTIAFIIMGLVTGVLQGTYAVLMFLFAAHYYQCEALGAYERNLNHRRAPVMNPGVRKSAPVDGFLPGTVRFPKFANPLEAHIQKTSDKAESLLNSSDWSDDLALMQTEEESVETNLPVENEAPNEAKSLANQSEAQEEEYKDEEAEFEEEAQYWLQGLDIIFGDANDVNQMFAQNAKPEKD